MVVSKPKIAFESKAPFDENAEHMIDHMCAF